MSTTIQLGKAKATVRDLQTPCVAGVSVWTFVTDSGVAFLEVSDSLIERLLDDANTIAYFSQGALDHFSLIEKSLVNAKYVTGGVQGFTLSALDSLLRKMVAECQGYDAAMGNDGALKASKQHLAIFSEFVTLLGEEMKDWAAKIGG